MAKRFGASISGVYQISVTVSPAPKTGGNGEHETTRSFYLTHEDAESVFVLLESKEKKLEK